MKICAPLLALVGPTGVGKSTAALACAERLGGEIISCDSVQVYRGFDIGSAKLDAAVRARLPHHLVDCSDWHETFDAMAFVTAATAAIQNIQSRGKVAILCGGTGLYLRALTHGLIEVASDAELRARLTAQMGEHPRATYAQLCALDPAGAADISPHNPAYVVRALEICLLTQRPASEVRREQAVRAERSGPRVPLCRIALDGPTPWLRARIEARAGQMVGAGLLAEVRALLLAGVRPDSMPMRAVGYREAVAVLQGELPLADLASTLAKNTWAYARRQRTWLRREPPACRIDVTDADAQPLAEADLVEAILRAQGPGAAPGPG